MPSDPPRGSNNIVQTIQRACFILDLLGQSPQGNSIRDLSAKTNLNKATIHRLLSSLSHFGYVRQDSMTRNYFLGFKLVELGNQLLSQLDLRKEAEPYLRDLADRTNETVHMVVLDGKEIVYIDKIEGVNCTSSLRMTSRVGLRNPAHSSAVGKVLLADLSVEALNQLIGGKSLPKRTKNTITDSKQLKEKLNLIRRDGYAIDNEENERGIRCVAAPIRNEAGRAIAGVSISGPAFRVTKKVIRETFGKEVMNTASKISRRLGFRESR